MDARILRYICLGMLPLMLLVSACRERHEEVPADSVESVQAGEVTILPADDAEIIAELMELFNAAGYERTAKSGPATHRLVLRTTDGAQYTLLRINEEKVEVGLRQAELRKNFFLVSPALSQLIQTICEESLAEAGP